MSFVPQKELVTGVERHPLDADVPNVIEKLFALKNQCTECNVCEVACSLVHSPDGTVNPQYARLKIDHAPDKASRVNPDGLGFIAEIHRPVLKCVRLKPSIMIQKQKLRS